MSLPYQRSVQEQQKDKVVHKSGLVLGGGEGGRGWPSFAAFVTCLADRVSIKKILIILLPVKRRHKLYFPLAIDGNSLEQGFFFSEGKKKHDKQKKYALLKGTGKLIQPFTVY